MSDDPDPLESHAAHRAAVEASLRAGAWLWRTLAERQEAQRARAAEGRQRALERCAARHRELQRRLTVLEAGGDAAAEIAALQLGLAASRAHLQGLVTPPPPPRPLDDAQRERLDRARYAEARRRSAETAEVWRRARDAQRAAGDSPRLDAVLIGARLLRRDLIGREGPRLLFWARPEDALAPGAAIPVRLASVPSTTLAIAAVEPPDPRGLQRATGYLLD